MAERNQVSLSLIGNVRLLVCFVSEEHECCYRGHQDENSDQLGDTHVAVQQDASIISTETLQEKATCAMKNQKPQKNLPFKFFL